MNEQSLSRGLSEAGGFIKRNFDNLRGTTLLKTQVVEALCILEEVSPEANRIDIYHKIVELYPRSEPPEIRSEKIFHALDLLKKDGIVAWRHMKADEACDKEKTTGKYTYYGDYYHLVTN